MGLSKRTGLDRVLPWDQSQPTPIKANGHARQKAGIFRDESRRESSNLKFDRDMLFQREPRALR